MPTKLPPPSITLDACAAGITRHYYNAGVHLLLKGWYLQHAAAIHALPVSDRGQGRKSSPPGGLDLSTGDKAGFRGWLKDSFGDARIAVSTAYNYITAADAAGLTLDLTPEQAEAAAEKFCQELSSKHLAVSSLWKSLPSSEPETPAARGPNIDEELELWQTFRSTLPDLTADEGKGQQALFKMPLQDLSDLESGTRRALDVISAALKAVKAGSGANGKGGRAK